MKAFFAMVLVIILIGIGASLQNVIDDKRVNEAVGTFEECVAAGNPILESYPEQCRTRDGRTFVHDIGNELDKVELIRISSPRPGDVIESPLLISGEARGYWFFEANAPLILTDWDGKIIAEGYIETVGNWMTEDFVSFKGELRFETPEYGERGTLIIRKANPSGLPEHDDALEVPVRFVN